MNYLDNNNFSRDQGNSYGTVNTMNNLNNNGNFIQNDRDLNHKISLSPKANNLVKISGNENSFFPSNDDYMMKMQKVEQQKLYKDFLDSQVNLFLIK